MSLFEKSSAPSRWEYAFDSILLVFFVLPSLLWTAAWVLCSNTLSIGDPLVCVILAFAPLATLVQYLIVFNFILGGCLVTFPLIVIAYVAAPHAKVVGCGNAASNMRSRNIVLGL